jgi:hypothetical protein
MSIADAATRITAYGLSKSADNLANAAFVSVRIARSDDPPVSASPSG